MSVEKSEQTIAEQAIALVAADKTLAALPLLDQLASRALSPQLSSAYALCLARERGRHGQGLEMCARAIESEPERAVHYLRAGQIHLQLGHKREAIELFRQGLAHGDHDDSAPAIRAQLQRLGLRRRPPLPFLDRNNVLNKYLGMLLARLRRR